MQRPRLQKEFRQTGIHLISSGRITLAEARLGFQRGLLARDPDGHAVELGEP
ncbi:MAG TPA: hypothetical protein VG204_09960 [Terriglobia bacterium]|nr:hypothetical protein [Terriglobia bacterium]